MPTILAALIALLASAGAAICAYADGALLSIDPDEPPAEPALAALVHRRDRAHRALAFARIALQVTAGVACGVAVRSVTGFATIPLFAMVLAGVLLVVLSETVAREAGDQDGLRGLTRMRALTEIIERGLLVVVLLGEWVERAVDNLVAPPPHDEAREEADVERFRQVVTTQADVSTAETPILTGVFALGDTTVEEVMTPRIDVIGIERDASWDEVVARARSSEHARILVYDGNLDHITGVLYAKDLLPFVADGTQPPAGWLSIVNAASFIPLSKRVDAQLREFRSGHRHLAVVVDEFGGTAGIVTIEDLLELIVGDIQDEHDTETPELEVGDGGRFWAAGRMSLDDLSEKLGADLRHDEVATVGGLAYELFGRVPKAGEAVLYRSWKLQVENVRGRRVERVQLERVPAPVGAGVRE